MLNKETQMATTALIWPLTTIISEYCFFIRQLIEILGRVAQSGMCLATDASLSCEFDHGLVPYFRGD